MVGVWNDYPTSAACFISNISHMGFMEQTLDTEQPGMETLRANSMPVNNAPIQD